MIPADLSARLRMLAEASFFDSEPPIQGTARIRELQARLPDLLPGQRFTAHLQRALPDGTFQAVVAGRTYTLALNHSAKAGDTLELVVTQAGPRAVFAQLANPQAAGPAPNAGNATLSTTGRLISFMLTGQPAPPPAALAGGKPLLDAPPMTNGAPLAPLLRQALGQSGLFYESHQSRWIAGKHDLASLLREPQGQQALARAAAPPAGGAGFSLPSPASGPSAQPGAGPAPGGAAAPPAGTPPPSSGAGAAAPAAALPQSSAPVAPVGGERAAPAPGTPSAGTESTQAQSAQNTASSNAAQRLPIVPDRLMPVVHQQLDALATHTYVWQGQVWPGQHVEWEIEDPDDDDARAGEEAAQEWNTTLRLTLPHLGGLEARLHLTPAGVALRLVADTPETVNALDAARARLDDALAAVDVPLTGFVAEQRHDDE